MVRGLPILIRVRFPGFHRMDVQEVIASFQPDRSQDATTTEKSDWESKVQGLLNTVLKRRGVIYTQLVEKLSEIGVSESEPNIRNKLTRGKFTEVFLVQGLEAIGAKEIRI